MFLTEIDFSQDFPMFKNGGAEGFTFGAAYGSTIVGNLKHSGRIVGHQTEFSFDEVTVRTLLTIPDLILIYLRTTDLERRIFPCYFCILDYKSNWFIGIS